MARVNADQYVEKHARRTKAATEDMRIGVEGVTEAPTAKAAAKKDKMRQNIINSIDSGKWERGLRRVTNEEWKRKMIDKGIPRVAAGIDGAADKIRSFAAELLPFQDTLQASVKRMPDVTLDDSINRMVSWTRGMSKFERKG